MKTHSLNAQNRELFGRKVKRLRSDGILPSNLFGNDQKSQGIQLNTKDFTKTFKEVGETGIIDLTIDKTTTPVLVSNVHFDPLSSLPLHVDFRRIDLKQKVTATVPIELLGESSAVKEGLGTLVQQLHELEVEALPGDLPESLQVDISSLKAVDDTVAVGDVKYDKSKLQISALEDQIIAQIAAQREEEPEPAPTTEEPESPQTEGETPEVKEAKE